MNTNQTVTGERTPARRMTVAEELEVSMRSSLRDIRNQCRFVITNSTNRELVAFAQLIYDKTA